jgi:NO-binding membrane sensor protein with MHYT domain
LNAITKPDLLGADFLAFDWTHNIVHVVLAAVALYVGFMAPANLCNLYAKTFGIVYLGLGVAGFFWNGISATVLHLELGENLVHIVIGAWGVTCGFFGTTTGTPTTTNTAKATTTTTPPRKA